MNKQLSLNAYAGFIAFVVLFTTTGKAEISLDARIEFLESQVAGSCELIISHDEPYSAINADCDMKRDDVVVSHTQIAGFDLGWPRSAAIPAYFAWPTLSLPPKGGSDYCQVFGDYAGNITLGHHSDENLNITIVGRISCDVAPEPPSCQPNIQITVQACDGLWNNTQVTATLPGYDITNILYQIKPGGIHSSWPFETIYDGEVSTCPIASTLGNFFASIVISTAYGDSSCGIPVHVNVCEEEGGGFPQF